MAVVLLEIELDGLSKQGTEGMEQRQMETVGGTTSSMG